MITRRTALGLTVWVLVLLGFWLLALRSWPPQSSPLYTGFLGGILGAWVTVLVAAIAWHQLGTVARTTSARFLVELKRDFFTRETRVLFQLVDCGWLEFVPLEDGHSFFKLKEKELEDEARKSGLDESIIQRLTRKKVYSTYDIDDCLLGHLEDVGLLEGQGILDIAMVYEEFDHYIEESWGNPEIKRYIEFERKRSSDYYDQLEYIARKCEKWGKIKNTSCPLCRFIMHIILR